jgi:hypothetical protein
VVAPTSQRVPQQTDDRVNEAIRRRTEASIAYHKEHPDQIGRRIRELDEEWDVERALETGSSVLTLFGLAMTLTRGRKWLVLPLAVQGFFLQHALQGWCPPLPLFRRLGFRTQSEIEHERCALRRLRGDLEEESSQWGRKRSSGDIVEVKHQA